MYGGEREERRRERESGQVLTPPLPLSDHGVRALGQFPSMCAGEMETIGTAVGSPSELGLQPLKLPIDSTAATSRWFLSPLDFEMFVVWIGTIVFESFSNDSKRFDGLLSMYFLSTQQVQTWPLGTNTWRLSNPLTVCSLHGTCGHTAEWMHNVSWSRCRVSSLLWRLVFLSLCLSV